MATDYGTDIRALLDLPEVEELITGDDVLAQEIAHAQLTPADAHEEIGDTAPYDCFDVRIYLGRRFNVNDGTTIDEIQAQAAQVSRSKPKVHSVSVAVSYAQGVLAIASSGQGENGPFNLVLSVDGLTAQILRGG